MSIRQTTRLRSRAPTPAGTVRQPDLDVLAGPRGSASDVLRRRQDTAPGVGSNSRGLDAKHPCDVRDGHRSVMALLLPAHGLILLVLRPELSQREVRCGLHAVYGLGKNVYVR